MPSAAEAAAVGSAPLVVRSIREWRRLRSEGVVIPRSASVALVPTMGALHDGHLSLVAEARAHHDVVVASLFVNPTQFGEREDYERYPRTLDDDVAKLDAAGVDFVFAPAVEEMYPRRAAALAPYVDLSGIDALAEARHRPGHFRGVATVVTKLLNIVQPTAAYFGQKDAMQCIVVKRLVEALDMDTRVHIGQTVREADGLAMSSRNRFLSSDERAAAPAVYGALRAVGAAVAKGVTQSEELVWEAAAVIGAEPLLKLEYVSVASAADGAEIADLAACGDVQEAVVSIAVKIGRTRLIDNILLPLPA